VKNKSGIFYGYIVVIFAFISMLVAFGIYDSFGIFYTPLISQFGWTSATISGSFSISILIFGVIGVLMGHLTDRFGPRIILTLSGIITGLGYLLMSQINTLWHIYLFMGIIIGIGMSGLYAPVISLIARWFTARRGLMTGIVISGMGIGQLISPLIVSRLIATYDWQLSYIILGSAILIVIVVSAQILKRPDQIEQIPHGTDATGQRVNSMAHDSYTIQEAFYQLQFWLILLIKLCFGFYMFSIVVHIVPHAIGLGVSPIMAANILAICGGASIIGDYIMGRAGDKIGPRSVFIIDFILASASLLWLTQVNEIWMFYLFAAIFGFASGGNITSDSSLAARLFGLKSVGSIVGIASLGFSIGAAIGPFVTGSIFDVTRSYQTAFIVCAGIGIVGIVFAALLRPTKRLGMKV